MFFVSGVDLLDDGLDMPVVAVDSEPAANNPVAGSDDEDDDSLNYSDS